MQLPVSGGGMALPHPHTHITQEHEQQKYQQKYTRVHSNWPRTGSKQDPLVFAPSKLFLDLQHTRTTTNKALTSPIQLCCHQQQLRPTTHVRLDKKSKIMHEIESSSDPTATLTPSTPKGLPPTQEVLLIVATKKMPAKAHHNRRCNAAKQWFRCICGHLHRTAPKALSCECHQPSRVFPPAPTLSVQQPRSPLSPLPQPAKKSTSPLIGMSPTMTTTTPKATMKQSAKVLNSLISSGIVL